VSTVSHPQLALRYSRQSYLIAVRLGVLWLLSVELLLRGLLRVTVEAVWSLLLLLSDVKRVSNVSRTIRGIVHILTGIGLEETAAVVVVLQIVRCCRMSSQTFQVDSAVTDEKDLRGRMR
jgi:hypothetical protein